MSIIQWGTPEPASYKGDLRRANPLLHQEAFALLKKINLRAENIFDVGAGQGAFSARLADACYSITAVDKNVDSAHSRIKFLISGLFEPFALADYEGSGHIHPLSVQEIQFIARGVDVEIVSVQTLCKLPWLIISSKISNVLQSMLSMLLRPFTGSLAGGDIICIVLRKPEPSSNNIRE
jgi:hypothetical protein